MNPTLPTFPKVSREQGTIEGVELKHLIEEFGSPLFIFSERIIIQKVAELQSALQKYYPNSQIAYSVKTNYIPAILKILRREKSWAEVTSGFEYWLAKKLDFTDKEIIFNGTDKDESALYTALQNGAIINTDNFHELEKIGNLTLKTRKSVSIGLRINVQVGLPFDGKFGFDLNSGEAYEVVKLINKRFPKISITGLHVHLGPYIKDIKFYMLAAEQLSDFALTLKKDFDYNMTYLDLGGGIPAPGARPFDQEIWVVPEVSDYIKEIAAVLNRKFPNEKPQLQVEPGKYLVDESGVLLTTVIDVKTTALCPQRTQKGVFLRLRDDAKDDAGDTQLVNVNASSTSTIPTANVRHRLVDLVSNNHSVNKDRLKTIVGGNSCMSNDFLSWDTTLPRLFPGDHLIFYNVGAYELARSQQFIHPRPAVVMIYENGDVQCVRKGESFDHIVALDEF